MSWVGIKKCPMKGRRCAELASGQFERFLQSSLAKTQHAFLVCSAKLDKDEDIAALQADFRIAMDILLTEATVKTAHWKQLPWHLVVSDRHEQLSNLV